MEETLTYEAASARLEAIIARLDSGESGLRETLELCREGLRAVARRFGWASLAALLVLIATGAWLASEYGQWDNGTLHVKLALVVLAGVLILWHLRAGTAHWLQGAIFLVSLVIVWLGLALAH